MAILYGDYLKAMIPYLSDKEFSRLASVSKSWALESSLEARRRAAQLGCAIWERGPSKKTMQAAFRAFALIQEIKRDYPQDLIETIGLFAFFQGQRVATHVLTRHEMTDRLGEIDLSDHRGPLAWGKDRNGYPFVSMHLQLESGDLRTYNIFKQSDLEETRAERLPFLLRSWSYGANASSGITHTNQQQILNTLKRLTTGRAQSYQAPAGNFRFDRQRSFDRKLMVAALAFLILAALTGYICKGPCE